MRRAGACGVSAGAHDGRGRRDRGGARRHRFGDRAERRHYRQIIRRQYGPMQSLWLWHEPPGPSQRIADDSAGTAPARAPRPRVRAAPLFADAVHVARFRMARHRRHPDAARLLERLFISRRLRRRSRRAGNKVTVDQHAVCPRRGRRADDIAVPLAGSWSRPSLTAGHRPRLRRASRHEHRRRHQPNDRKPHLAPSLVAPAPIQASPPASFNPWRAVSVHRT